MKKSGGGERRGRSSVRSRTHRVRTRVLSALVVGTTVACVARLVDLQIMNGDAWLAASISQNSERVSLHASRGGLYDRQRRPLSLYAEEYRAYLAPGEAGGVERTIEPIDRILGLTGAEKKRLRAADHGWVTIRSHVSSTDRDRLMAAVRTGLHFDTLATRVYPEGRLARGLLGTIDEHGRGVSGIELALDSVLRGTPGKALRRRDATQALHRLPGRELTLPRPGYDVVLTIDAELQAIARAALEQAIEETGAAGGDVIMADPRSGEILAVASYREGQAGVPAFSDPYEPGSTLKPFLLASLLNEGAASLGDSVDTEGGTFQHTGRVIRDEHPHDRLTVAGVVQFSSNIGAVKLAGRLERGMQYRYLRDFGFGVPTGINYPAESAGLLRRPGEWSGLSQASLAMGYELSVTSLQLIAAYGALANGGVLMRPYIVKEIRATDGGLVWRRDPEPIRRVISEEVAAKITAVLSSVVEEGTGFRAALTTLPIAGKTGTARLVSNGGYSERRYAASFVGYCPSDAPSLVILAKIEDPQGPLIYGGAIAAPISASTLQAAMAARGVTFQPRAPHPARTLRFEWGGEGRPAVASPYIFAVDASPIPWSGSGKARPRPVLPDLAGMPVRAAVTRLLQLQVDVELRASGIVHGQDPPPGTEVRSGTRVVLR